MGVPDRPNLYLDPERQRVWDVHRYSCKSRAKDSQGACWAIV